MISIPRTLYTIHKHADMRAFSIHMEQKTYMLCFESNSFARITAHILENHYKQVGTWPNTEVSVNEPLRLSYNMDKEALVELPGKELSHLYVQEWSSALVQDYVINNLFHMMIVEGDYSAPTTRCITFGYPDSHVRRILEKRELD